jgi:hypothetical protein
MFEFQFRDDVLEILKLYQPYDDIPIFKAETNVKDLIV